MSLIIGGRIVELCLVIVFFLGQLFFVRKAIEQGGGFLRRVPGLDAIDEIVGRATEMGKAVHLSPGVSSEFGSNSGPIIAALAIFGHVASVCSDKGVRVLASISDAGAYAAIDEVIRTSFQASGAIENYRPEDIQFYAYGQAMLTGVFGTMMRRKPAGNFLIGTFGWDAVVQGELGATVGSMQLGGTDSFANLAMLVATCDYVLIGEEILAAGAYISKEPQGIGALQGQDFAKGIAIILIIVGSILWLAGNDFVYNFLAI